MVIIKNVTETKESQNLFFLFEGNAVVELVIALTEKPSSEDRMIRIEVPGTLSPHLARVPPPATVDLVGQKASARLVQARVKRLETDHGTAFYDFSRTPFFVHFRQKADSPPLTTLELVKAKRKWGRFEYEIPVQPEQVTRIDGQPFFFYPIQAPSKGEAYYLRVQARGERLPRSKKLRK